MVIGAFLMHYDLNKPMGKVRPGNKTVDEIVVTDPEATVLVRRRN